MAMSRRQSLARRAKCEASNLRDAEESSSDESEVLQAVEEISAQGNTEAKRSTSVSKAAKDEDVTSDGELKSDDDDDDDDDDDNEEMEETNLSRKQIKSRDRQSTAQSNKHRASSSSPSPSSSTGRKRRLRKGGPSASSSLTAMSAGDANSAADAMSRKRRSLAARSSSVGSSSAPGKTRRGEVYEVVYDDPSAALRRQPWRRTRPRYKGDTVGEALVYGDSLTWAFQHDRFERFAMPWCELLRPRLWEKGLALVQSNFPERTTIYNDNPEHDLGWNVGTKAEDFNGIRHFGATFSSHSPKWLMIMLGTHDLKARVRAYARERAALGLHAEEDTNKPASDPGSGSDSSDSESEFSAESDTEVQDQKSPQNARTSGGRTASANADGNGHVGKGADVTATISEADARIASSPMLKEGSKKESDAMSDHSRSHPRQRRGRGAKTESAGKDHRDQDDDAAKDEESDSSDEDKGVKAASSGSKGLKATVREPEEGFEFTAQTIASNCERYIGKARHMYEGHCHEGNLKILFIAPPPIRLTPVSKQLGFDEESVRISEALPKAFAKLRRHHDVVVVVPSQAVMKGSVDGVHPTAKGHAALADLVWAAMQPELPRQTRKPERLTIIHR